MERASINGVGRSQVACLPLLGTVLSSCSSCNGAIKHQVKWWCQLRRWGTSQVAIFLIHMSLLYAQYHILTDVNQIWIGNINWSGRVPVIVLDVVHHVMAWSSIVIKWWSRRCTHHCTHCWSSAPAISYFLFFFFAFIILHCILTSVLSNSVWSEQVSMELGDHNWRACHC